MAPLRNDPSFTPIHLYINNPTSSFFLHFTPYFLEKLKKKMNSFSSPYSLSSYSSFFPTTSNDDFNLFHSIDRRLFSTLVHNLLINPAESMRVMAFLIWLERSGLSTNSVKKVVEWPWNLIHQLADQILAVLRCAENERFSRQKRTDISLLQKLCQRHVNLLQFHETRIEVLGGVSKIVNEVCVRAFEDLVQSSFVESSQFGVNHCPVVPDLPFEYSRVGGNGNFSQQNLPRREVSQVELTQILSGMNLGDLVSEEESAVPPDERTIFLTFSRGYPISEFEVRDFFTRYDQSLFFSS